jgi:hypothetical protein
MNSTGLLPPTAAQRPPTMNYAPTCEDRVTRSWLGRCLLTVTGTFDPPTRTSDR